MKFSLVVALASLGLSLALPQPELTTRMSRSCSNDQLSEFRCGQSIGTTGIIQMCQGKPGKGKWKQVLKCFSGDGCDSSAIQDVNSNGYDSIGNESSVCLNSGGDEPTKKEEKWRKEVAEVKEKEDNDDENKGDKDSHDGGKRGFLL